MFKSIIIIVSVVSMSFSQVKFSLDGEVGYIPRAVTSAYKTPKEIEYKATEHVFMLSLIPQLEWKFVYGKIDLTAFSAAPKQGIAYKPFRMSYGNEIGIFHNFDSFKLSLSWEHNCQHQVIVAVYYDQIAHFSDIGYDKIFIRFQTPNSR